MSRARSRSRSRTTSRSSDDHSQIVTSTGQQRCCCPVPVSKMTPKGRVPEQEPCPFLWSHAAPIPTKYNPFPTDDQPQTVQLSFRLLFCLLMPDHPDTIASSLHMYISFRDE